MSAPDISPRPRPAGAGSPQPLIVGWREHVDFPDWHIRRMIAKLDTGARTGALDVSEIEELPDGRVRFIVRLGRRSGAVSRVIEAPVIRRSRVRSASGHVRERLFVQTRIRIGPLVGSVELGLVCRKKMLCRVLLGRKVLDGHFLVDSGRRYLLGRTGGPRPDRRPPREARQVGEGRPAAGE